MKKLFFTTSLLTLGFSSVANAQIYMPSSHRSIDSRMEYSDWRHSLAEEDTFQWSYANFKKELKEKYGFSYTFDVSHFLQRTAPNGKDTASQTFYFGSLNWDIYQSKEYGKGSVQAAFNATRYGSTSAAEIASNSGFAQAINDFPEREDSIAQLMYTQQFAGNWDWLSVSAGQFPLYNFDGTSYDANQQVNFINYSLAQNGTSTYPVASLGAYANIKFNEEVSVIAGFQDATNIDGITIHTNDHTFEEITTFGVINYNPQFEGLGSSEFSLLVYDQPSTVYQPQNNTGYSINVMQNLNETWGVFGRINWTTDAPDGIDKSYVIGGVMNNPLGRNPLDQIGLAYAYNELNTDKTNGNTSYDKGQESTLEAYWAWGVSNFLTITPDLQVYFTPANSSSDIGFASTLRLTLML
ncbi:MAG: carbohydrate porin [Alphaproteobacteria bacterium]